MIGRFRVKRLTIFVGFIVLLLIGGGLTAQLAATRSGESLLPALLIQSDNPEASTLQITPWQGEQLFLLVGFILFNLIGIGVTLAVVMWFLHRGVKIAEATENASSLAVQDDQAAIQNT